MLIGGSHLFIPKGRRGTLPGIVLVSFIHFPVMFMRCFLVLRALLLPRAARADNYGRCCHEGKALKSDCLFHVIWILVRSEERRVGKECVITFRSWWSP